MKILKKYIMSKFQNISLLISHILLISFGVSSKLRSVVVVACDAKF